MFGQRKREGKPEAGFLRQIKGLYKEQVSTACGSGRVSSRGITRPLPQAVLT